MKKRALTLLEIMIVIFLITLITGTIGYSMRGTMDKGRAFKTKQAKAQIRDLLLISLAEGKGTADEIAASPAKYLDAMNLAKDPNKLLEDGWNEKFTVTVKGRNDFKVSSAALERYEARERNRLGKADEPSPAADDDD